MMIHGMQRPKYTVWTCKRFSPSSEGYEEGTNLVEDERGDAGRNNRVSNPDVPCHPLPLEPVELGNV
jgi:hypothetical protein